MNRLFLSFVLLASCCFAPAQASPKGSAAAAPLRSHLLHLLRTTHNQAEWFTPLNAAIAGLTPEQARWIPPNAQGKTDPSANHSAGMLAYHLLFWDRQSLARLQGRKPPQPASNAETFNDFNAANWPEVVRDVDRVMTELEASVENMSDAEIEKNASTIENIATHNAYHTGQILYVRKLQGSWNPANGVK